jgi:hypothetical protein
MATASNQRTPREVIEFASNVPVTVALKYNPEMFPSSAVKPLAVWMARSL